VIDQQELEDPRSRFDYVRRTCVHHHPVGADRRTRRLELGHFLDFDHAHATRAVDADARVIAVVRNGDAALDGRLKNGLAFLDSHCTSIDRQRDGIHKQSIIPGVRDVRQIRTVERRRSISHDRFRSF
jgi:hypothetical protein